jgi:hypothetical protein
MKKYLLLVLITIANSSYSASFDCSKAATPTEKAICSDKKLSLLDSFMSIDFKDKLTVAKDKNSVKEDQKQWNRTQRDKCGADTSCLVTIYQERLDGSLEYAGVDAYLLKDGWKQGKYLSGSRFCSYEYIKGSEKISLGVYCAGDAFNTLTYK